MKVIRWSVVAMVVALLLVSCTADNGAAPENPAPPVDLSTLQLAACAPESAATATAVIGRDGGTITVGQHTLVVPRRSLKDDVAITMQTKGDGEGVVFLPEGLQFKKSKPARLTMSYDGCTFGPVVPSPPDHDDDHSGHGHGKPPETTGIVYLSGTSQILEFLPSSVDSTSMTVTAELEHFSRYAVAW